MELDNETYIVFFAMLASFTILYFLGYCLRMRERPAVHRRFSVDAPRVIALFQFWAVVELIEVAYSGGVPAFWYLIGNGKTYFDFGIPSVHGAMNALGLVILMLVVHLLVNGELKNRKKLIAVAVTILAFYLLLITRQVLVSAAVEMVIVALMEKPTLVSKKVIPLLISGVLLFGIVGNLRTGYEAFIYVSLISTDVPPVFIGFYWVYMYFTMTIANINSIVTSTFTPVGLQALSSYIPSVFDFMLPSAGSDSSAFYVTQAYNQSGFFYDFYYGFGLPGVVCISGLYGWLGGILYRKYSTEHSVRSILCCAIASQIIILSFFANMLLYLPSGFQLIIVMLIFRRKRSLLPVSFRNRCANR